jgi:hypothetical protein
VLTGDGGGEVGDLLICQNTPFLSASNGQADINLIPCRQKNTITSAAITILATSSVMQEQVTQSWLRFLQLALNPCIHLPS